MRGNRVMLVDYSFIRFDVRFAWICYGREQETCLPTSSTAVTDRKGLDVRSNPEAQDSATLAPLKERTFLRTNDPECRAAFPESDRTIGDSIGNKCCVRLSHNQRPNSGLCESYSLP